MAGRPLRLPEVLTDTEREALLAQPNPKCPTGLRNQCMLRLMVDAGLRVGEVLALQVRDLDWAAGKVMIRQGKGAKDRVVWINEDLLELLRQWRERRPAGSNGLLFTTLQGGELDARYIRELVKRLAKRAGIEKDVHPHLLRHTMATDLLRSTKNLRLVQKALGHSNITTTTIYAHIVDGELEEAMKGLRSR
ncbi:MAG: tyrosine-type recombinase/integrase [Bacillota bacterium]|nr:tyrosine-type recombinase/integrase [Bacillota bacterium]